MIGDVQITESEEVCVDDLLKFASKYLNEQKLKKLKEFIDSNKDPETGSIVILSHELAEFLIRECSLKQYEVVAILKFFNLPDDEIEYVLATIRVDPLYSR